MNKVHKEIKENVKKIEKEAGKDGQLSFEQIQNMGKETNKPSKPQDKGNFVKSKVQDFFGDDAEDPLNPNANAEDFLKVTPESNPVKDVEVKPEDIPEPRVDTQDNEAVGLLEAESDTNNKVEVLEQAEEQTSETQNTDKKDITEVVDLLEAPEEKAEIDLLANTEDSKIDKPSLVEDTAPSTANLDSSPKKIQEEVELLNAEDTKEKEEIDLLNNDSNNIDNNNDDDEFEI